MIKNVLFCYYLCLIFGISATIAKTSNDNSLRLIHADRMEANSREGREFTRFLGNVEFLHGKIRLKSQIADYYKARQYIQLKDNVKMIMHGREICANRINYSKKDQNVKAIGNLVIKYFDENVTIKGSSGIYLRDENIAKIFGRPILSRIDSAKNDTLTIIADSMKYSEEEKKASALGNVVITSGKIKAIGGKSDFMEKNKLVLLSKEPQFFLDSNVLSGELIELVLKGQTPEKVNIYKNATGKYIEQDSIKTDKRISELFGDTISMKLDSGVITQILTKHNAKNIYYKPNRKDVADKTSGSFIRMEFEKNKVIEVVINGNANSIYYNWEKGKVIGRNNGSGDTIRVCFEKNKVSDVIIFGGAKGIYLLDK